MTDATTSTLHQWVKEEEEEEEKTKATGTARSATLWTVGVISASWTIAVTLAVIVHAAAAAADKEEDEDEEANVLRLALSMLSFSMGQQMHWTLRSHDLVMNLPMEQVVSPGRRAVTYCIAGFGAIVLFLHLPPGAAAALLLPCFAVQVAVAVMAGVTIYCQFTAN